MQMRCLSWVSGKRAAHGRGFFRMRTGFRGSDGRLRARTPLDVFGEGRHGLSNW